MNRHLPTIVLLVGALAASTQAAAHGGGHHGGGNGWYGPVIGAAVVGAVVGSALYGGRDRTVYVERQPVYYGPPPGVLPGAASTRLLPTLPGGRTLRAGTTALLPRTLLRTTSGLLRPTALVSAGSMTVMSTIEPVDFNRPVAPRKVGP